MRAGARRSLSGAATSAASDSSCSVFDGLGDVVGGAGLEALLAVALHRLGGERDDRQRAELRVVADLPHRLVAVHLRHHDVHQHERRGPGRCGSARSPRGPSSRSRRCMPWRSSRLDEREDVADVVVDDQHALAGQRLVGVVQASRACAASPAGRSAITRCRNSAVSSSRRSGDCTPLSTMLLAILRSCDLLAFGELAAGEHDDRHVAQAAAPVWIRASSSKPGDVGQLQVEHDAVERSVCASLPAPRRRVDDGRDLDVVVARSARRCSSARPDRPRRPAAVAAGACVNVLMRSNARSMPSVVSGLFMYANAPRSRPCWRSSSTVTICTGMWRVHRVPLELVEHRPAEHVGQEDVERDRRRQVLARERQASVPRIATTPLKPRLRARSSSTLRVVRIVLDDQQHGVARLRRSRDRPRPPRRARRRSRSAGIARGRLAHERRTAGVAESRCHTPDPRR